MNGSWLTPIAWLLVALRRGWDFRVWRRSDQSVIICGPATYIIADAFVTGG